MDTLERARAWAKFPGTWSEFLKAEEQEYQRKRMREYMPEYRRKKRSGVVQFERSVYVTAESNAE